MKRYRVTSNKSTYSVTLDAAGVVDVDGLLPSSVETLKFSVQRYMKRHKLPLLRAFGKAIGPYATAQEVDVETSVSDLL